MIENFMLKNDTAVRLYEKYAKNAPVYDYHCHLSAKEIYEDAPFENISSIWLDHDHYKWRAMRFAGVSEDLVTGNFDPLDKFNAWAKVCGRLIGSPLYHWANMELEAYFGIEDILNEDNSTEIYNYCNKVIKSESLSPVKMIEASNVKLICTTDDPIDDLEYHKKLAKKGLSFKVLPTFRPDKVFKLADSGYKDYISGLEKAVGMEIDSFASLKEALKNRVDYFAEAGCLLSDHSLESLASTTQTDAEVDGIFKKALSGETVSAEEGEKFKNQTLIFLSNAYSQKNWVMQIHIGALRNNNEKMFKKTGPDSGFDVMNDFPVALPLSDMLKSFNRYGTMPKIVLYTLNDKDNLVLSTLPHCFSEEGTPGKIQFGAPWWFNDHKDGFYKHFTSLGNQGMLADFIGMLTDSRSFLSYVRHDYFRRILCDFIGNLVEEGEFEDNDKILGQIVEGICYKNIKNYLGVE